MPVSTQTKRLTKPTPEQIAAVQESTAIEREWYESWHHYADNEDVRRGIAQGKLLYVHESKDGKPIQRMPSKAPEHEKYWCYLGRGALSVLRYIEREWRSELDAKNLDPNGEYLLAYTSFTRAILYQAEIIEEGALAVDESTHEVGEALDTDASSYYRRLADGRYQSIPHPDRPLGTVAAIGDTLRPDGQTFDTTPEPRPDLYDPRITDALVNVGRRLAGMGLINQVIEFEGTANQLTHVAPNPNTINFAA